MNPRILSCLFCIASALPALAVADPPLFTGDSVLELTLTVDFKGLCRPRETEECDYVPTILEYGGGKRSIPVAIKVRGGWRSLTKHCSTPLLWLRFNEEDTPGSPFEGQTLLPLSTHCGKGRSIEFFQTAVSASTMEQYVLREYLGYRLYNLLTENSVRARLARIVYRDPDEPDHLIPHYAFLTEHFDSVAARNDAELLPRGSFDPEKLDMRSADMLALFQFMIGHADWSISREHNIALLGTRSGAQVPLPYDLDMSGLVDPYYAGPPPGLPIDGVRQRHYLGYCHPGTDWQELFAKLAGAKDATLEMVELIPGLDRRSVRSATRYLEKFFDILNSEDKRNEFIVNACQPWPPPADDGRGDAPDG